MICPPDRTDALGFSADSVASGKSAFHARSGRGTDFGRAAVTGMRSRQADADRVAVVGNRYRLVETTPTA